jgi:hypothetical protein
LFVGVGLGVTVGEYNDGTALTLPNMRAQGLGLLVTWSPKS